MGHPEVPETSAPDAENKASESPQTPTPADAAVTKVAQEAVAVKDSLQTKLGNWLKDIYNSNKFLFYTIIPLMGIIYLIIKFHQAIIDLLVGSSKELLKDQQAKDAEMAKQADAAKSAADALVKDADSLPGKQPPVTPDWDKK